MTWNGFEWNAMQHPTARHCDQLELGNFVNVLFLSFCLFPQELRLTFTASLKPERRTW